MLFDKLPARPSPNSPAGLKYENKRLKQENKDLKNQALIDSLTGLYNRRYLNQQLENLAQSGNVKGITALMFDVDNFGDFNNELDKIHGKEKGHFLGDQVLIKLASILDENTQATDLVARFGGDEFVAIFPNITDMDSIQHLVYRIHDAMEEGLTKNNIHVSFGFATTVKEDPTKPQSFLPTLQEADRHLLEMKKYKNIL
ncbi:MAG: Diguanylate cyclase [Candidatus Shapirobacteria bacterium GW2011_GWE1_38_10]|uniref:Diguanylate cyclase n=1 Tax=Candidatus Shapirobacteria bacterium GW2011_GWE1_38_10 TaxID=1618488 RepID=A0A0G0LDT9_9BACT|nr:MAG: Diguanylate cyclase [Candidatus Shapirobacteria bacterium GW2011_GWF2_37_20]KKQ50816.1 MAG: Diguanylate cyclase [Candidatus Shapirobacteria bacterium GW2011_GWE1_38_10]KKQ64885.1 MAG: Diguanylate cyclase [Candidatus Shapirobacteria bacterium GW2011_GWF1_38_23]HBP51028.1 hypothetical protein [Candidatus Shapirobacteria bacterium]